MPVVPNKISKSDEKSIHSDTGNKMFEEAKYYYKATQILEKEHDKKELFPPVLMNATFSCELFSKSILFKSQSEKIIKGHSLKGLYDNFDEDIKVKMRQLYKKGMESRFEKCIDEIGDLFEFWRYRYEYKSYSTHYSFVLEYMEILYKIAQSIYS